MRKEKEGGRRERYLTYDEEARLTKALTGELFYLEPAVVVALGTWMRKSEMFRLKVEHINFSGVPVFYPVNGREVETLPNRLLVTESKNKRPRAIPMNPAVRATLLSLVQDAPGGERIFSYARTGVSDMTIRSGFKEACKLAEITYGQTNPGGLESVSKPLLKEVPADERAAEF